MIVASGIAMQFGAKPLFSNVAVKFGGGNRYGLIGANGCGKSTFMKILGGELEQSARTVAIDSNERVGWLTCPGGLESYRRVPITSISTRRFFCRPSFVLLLATGCFSPLPSV